MECQHPASDLVEQPAAVLLRSMISAAGNFWLKHRVNHAIWVSIARRSLATLIAERDAGGRNAVYKLDLRLQGGDEDSIFRV